MGKPDGWKACQKLTDKAAESIEEIVENNDLEIDDAMKKIKSIENQIKCTAFGKTRINTNKVKKKIESLEKRKLKPKMWIC